MANYQNHVIDPNYFNDAIAEFAFDYDWFVKDSITTDDLGRRVSSFKQQTINGSLQPEQSSLNQSTNGNTETLKYRFYCRSLYRIDIGDFIKYKNRWLHVDGVQDLDEYGVRIAMLTMADLNRYSDLRDYIKYLGGEITV